MFTEIFRFQPRTPKKQNKQNKRNKQNKKNKRNKQNKQKKQNRHPQKTNKTKKNKQNRHLQKNKQEKPNKKTQEKQQLLHLDVRLRTSRLEFSCHGTGSVATTCSTASAVYLAQRCDLNRETGARQRSGGLVWRVFWFGVLEGSA